MKLTKYLKCVKKLPPHVSCNSRIKGEFVTALDSVFPKAYKPAAVERGVYEFWEENGYFSTKNVEPKFSLVLPPPNVTGTLHLGHALTAAIQDALVRWHRMEGRDVLWIPGLDHAGIATQTVVERWLRQKKNVTRHEIGREKFLEEVLNWKNEKGSVIKQQLKRFGASLDWSREIFTMDSRHNDAVVEAMVRLWNTGLVYRRESLINWSCELSSAISDIEVDRLEMSGPTEVTVPGYDKPVVFGELTNFVYRVCDSDEKLVVSTTRPETMLGDVAVAVHPNDARYTHLHNTYLWHPFRRTSIPVICDAMVDMQIGTGAVKITPGHSHVDWEVAQRHNLPLLSVIDESGCIIRNHQFDKFQGMKRFEARNAIRHELANLGLLQSVQPHSMQVPMCSRSGDIVEYLLKDQWFISCKKMAERAADAVREGRLQIEPTNFHTIWFNWLENIRDWCISRQLWWGHRMPLYFATKDNSSIWVAAASLPQAIKEASSLLGSEPDSISQDPDVLDTWFSSALYPLSALGWPNKTDDLQNYYPLDLMETGHDILFFWVARMVMLGEELTGKLPFKKISLHGIICDAQGRKMSKSLGNVINPEDVICGITLKDLQQKVVDSHKAGLLSCKEMELALDGQQKMFPSGIPECGTDALRFTLLSHNTKSHFISFDVRECETNHHFCNKVWQASRFALYWSAVLGVSACSPPACPGLMDRWVLSQLGGTTTTITAALQSADLSLATTALKEFLYAKFCDVYVETTKPVLRDGSDLEAANACQTLLYCLDVSLRLASPIMPFISEQLYKHLPGNHGKSAMLAQFPATDVQKWEDPKINSTVQSGIEILSAIRTLKGVHGFYKKHVPVEVETARKEPVLAMKSVIELLANCTVHVSDKTGLARKQTLTDTVGDHSLVHISLENISQEQYDEYMATLTRKETKIKKSLDKMIERTTKKGYERKVDKETQLRHSEMIRQLEEELRVLRSYMDDNRRRSSG
uniref:valine--tRNA ligase n=1 Tax=Cuerna arida TaxID=1464854 RepID=A0A1B6ERU2_9HEMI